MNQANNVRQYDLFKLVVAILLFLTFLILFLWTRSQAPGPQQTDATPLPTLTSVSATRTPVSPTATSSPIIPSPTETQMSDPTSTPTIPAPTATSTPAAEATDASGDETTTDVKTCEEIAKSQIDVGMTVKMLQRLNFRSSPSIRDDNRILTHRPGNEVSIIGGPICTRYLDGGAYLWWQIELPNGLVGWSAEASIFGDYYFMEPSE